MLCKIMQNVMQKVVLLRFSAGHDTVTRVCSVSKALPMGLRKADGCHWVRWGATEWLKMGAEVVVWMAAASDPSICSLVISGSCNHIAPESSHWW